MVRLYRYGIAFENGYWIVYQLETSNKSVYTHQYKEEIHRTRNRDEAYYFIKGKRKQQNDALGINPSRKGFVRRFLDFVRSHHA